MIKQAAILRDGEIWTLPRPARHHNILWAMYDVDNNSSPDKRPGIIPARGDQGFITTTGRFVTREEGFQEAVRCNQLKSPPTDGYKVASKLFSEDLW